MRIVEMTKHKVKVHVRDMNWNRKTGLFENNHCDRHVWIRKRSLYPFGAGVGYKLLFDNVRVLPSIKVG